MSLGSWLAAGIAFTAPPGKRTSSGSALEDQTFHVDTGQMTFNSESDRFVRSLAEENAQLRALLQKQADANLPPSPPTTATDSCSSRPMSPVDMMPDPLLRRASQAREHEDESPLRTIIELLRVQITSQSAAQDKLLDQLGELRSSYASLQAATSDVTDELVVMREKSATLAAQVEAERRERRQMEEEKTAEAEKVLTLRAKVEESRRAIMRLQDEAAARRASDSRRGSAALISSPFGVERRGSIGLPGSVGPSRRGSLALCETASPANSAVGLGLDLAGQAPIAADSLSRRTSLAHVAVPSPLAAGNGSHRRAFSVSASQHAPKGEGHLTDERLAALRHSHRAVSEHDHRRRSSLTASSLAAVREDTSSHPQARRVGSLSVVTRGSAGRLSLPAARRHSSLANGGDSSRTSLGEDEASAIRSQLEALQRRLADIEVSSGPPRKLNDYVMSAEGTPASTGRRASAQMAQFGAFSFQIQGRNPALLDTPPSPSGGTFSPGGTRRATNEHIGPFAHQQKETTKSLLSQETHASPAQDSSAEESAAAEPTTTSDDLEVEKKAAEEVTA